MNRIDVEVSEGRTFTARLENAAEGGDLVLSVEPGEDGRGWRSHGGVICFPAEALPAVRRALEQLDGAAPRGSVARGLGPSGDC